LFLIIDGYDREWDRFAKGEYERLAMEEENGEDSEMLDAMEGWDSEDDQNANAAAANNVAGAEANKSVNTSSSSAKGVNGA
jgi:hypothetical protein